MTNRSYSAMVVSFLAVGLFLFRAGYGHSAEGTPPIPRRISGQIVDLGKVNPIYMVPGMATLIEIPDAVTGIRLGNPDAVQYFQPSKPDNEVTLVLKDASAKVTNLIVRSGKKKYVFDVVPSKTVHQDTVEVVGAYGGAEIHEEQATLIDSSEGHRGQR